MKVKPLVRWVGGKRSHVDSVLRVFPEKFDRYWEPFFGGGAVYMELHDRGWIGDAFLSDCNVELINAFWHVKRDWRAVYEQLEFMRSMQEHTGFSRYYCEVAREYAESLSGVARAARFLYLMKKCYGGLYRVNKDGMYNVPPANEREDTWYEEEALRNFSGAFDFASLLHHDFRRTTPLPGDVVYCDPPYYGTFDSYDENGFKATDHEELAVCCETWAAAGVHVVVTNADHPDVRSLYRNFVFRCLEGRKRVQKSQPTTELLIWSF